MTDMTAEEESGALTLDQVERQAREALIPHLTDHYRIARDASDLVSEALYLARPTGDYRELPLARRVAIGLLIRIINDLRSVTLLCARGYSLQAASLAASILEQTYTIVYIGTDEARAEQWVAHEQELESFARVKVMLSECLSEENHFVFESAVYAQLCMAKHANPMLQMRHGTRATEEGIEVSAGPEVGEHAIKVMWFALQHGARLACIAGGRFVELHLSHGLDQEKSEQFMALIERFGRELSEFSRRAIERFGAGEPFRVDRIRRPGQGKR